MEEGWFVGLQMHENGLVVSESHLLGAGREFGEAFAWCVIDSAPAALRFRLSTTRSDELRLSMPIVQLGTEGLVDLLRDTSRITSVPRCLPPWDGADEGEEDGGGDGVMSEVRSVRSRRSTRSGKTATSRSSKRSVLVGKKRSGALFAIPRLKKKPMRSAVKGSTALAPEEDGE